MNHSRPPLRIRELRIHRLAIPMRLRFEHALASRDVADPVVVVLRAGSPFAHVAGYGETLARPYVTGETPESVVEDVQEIFRPLIESFHATTFVEALEQIEALPFDSGGRLIQAARCAVELALIDLVCRVFERRPSDVAGWMGLAGFGAPGCLENATYSGIVVGSSKRKLQWLTRLQLLAGIRDFKLKVATEGWEERLIWAAQVLSGPIRRQRATLRVDANAGWTLAEATEAMPMLEQHGVSAIEQPLTDGHDPDLPYLAEQSTCDLIVDESLLTRDDGERLIEAGGVKVFNIRLAKNGGLMPALRLARMALSGGLHVQLGCLVGETSILTAAGLALLEACPRVRFVEGAFSTFLLQRDLVRRPLRIGWRGRVAPRAGHGWGIEVDTATLDALTQDKPRLTQF